MFKNLRLIFSMFIFASAILQSQDEWQLMDYPDPQGAMSLFATSQGVLLTGNGSKIMRSTDQGDSWQDVTVSGGWAHSIFDFAETGSGRLFAATADGLFASNDQGQRWVFARDAYMARHIKVADNGNLYLAYQGEQSGFVLQLSTNDGATWSDITPAGYEASYFVPQPLADGSLLLSTGQTLLRTSDDGQNWEEILNGSERFRFNSMAATDWQVLGAANINNQSYELYRSADGIEWTKVTTEPADLMLNWIQYNTRGGMVYGYAPGRGLMVSPDNASWWSDFSAGMEASEYVYDIAFCRDTRLIVTTSANNLYWRYEPTDNVEEENITVALRARPNPASDYIRIENISPECDKLALYNASGVMVKSYQLDCPAAAADINVSGLGPGIYFARITGITRSSVLPILITR